MARRFLFGIIDRCSAIGADSEGEVMTVYLQAERALFCPILPFEFVVPIALGGFDLDEPQTLSSNLRIEPLSDEIQRARASNETGLVSKGVADAATHGVVMSGVTLDNSQPWRRQLLKEKPIDRIWDVDMVFRALRVVSLKQIGYAQILRRPLGWADQWRRDLPPLENMGYVRNYPDMLDEDSWLRKKRVLPESHLNDLPLVLQGISDPDSPEMYLAARNLEAALGVDGPDECLLHCAIGLEALLGGATSHTGKQISRRAIALPLNKPPLDPGNGGNSGAVHLSSSQHNRTR